MSTAVMVADDDPNVRELVTLYCTREGISVIAVADGRDVLKQVAAQAPDLLVLDIMLPGADGWEVCRTLRGSPNPRDRSIPIIMLTARDEEPDRILGLELGADDYVTKPFSPRELVARIKAVLRRTTANAEPHTPLAQDGLLIDPAARSVTAGGRSIALTPKEFDLLAHLVARPRQVFSRDALLQQVWGYDFFGDARTVDVHIRRIRKKLPDPFDEYIQTVWGVGYKFEVPER